MSERGGSMKMSVPNNNPSPMSTFDQNQALYSSLVEISDGKGRPAPRRLVLSSTHLHVQRNVHKDAIVDNDADSNRPTHGSVSDRGLSGEGSFDSYVDTDSPPPEYNKRRGNTRKPYLAALTDHDVIIISNETFLLGQKYGQLQQKNLYNYLITLALQSKVECIDSFRKSGGVIDLYARNVLADARNVIIFQFYMFEEMVLRHLESEYWKLQDRSS